MTMARTAKMEKNMPMEEKLKQALVPEAEQPYPIPKNWCWVKLGAITQVMSGGTPLSNNSDYYEGGNIPWISPSDLSNYSDMYISNGAKSITELGLEKSSARLLPKNSVCLSSRAPIGYVVIAANPLCTNQGFKNFLPSFTYHPHYLYWYLKGNKELLESRASGTTFLELSASKVSTIELPLSPLAEQQRIVVRIESLFAKLDEAKEKAQAVIDGFEDRKAAILHKAFTGKLTKEWRKKNGLSKEDWKSVLLADVCMINPAKTNLKDLPDNLEVSFFFFFFLSETYGVITEPQIRKLCEVRNGFTNFSEGDVVFAKITPCMENGKSAVIGQLVNNIGFGTTEFYVLRCGEKLHNKFLWHLIRDRSFRNKAKAVMSGAVGQQRVPKKFLENYSFSLPSIKEQVEIVCILDNLFVREQQAREIAEQLIAQIETIKKSILARAFRGELGTNDPNDESAVELLKKIEKQNNEK